MKKFLCISLISLIFTVPPILDGTASQAKDPGNQKKKGNPEFSQVLLQIDLFNRKCSAVIGDGAVGGVIQGNLNLGI